MEFLIFYCYNNYFINFFFKKDINIYYNLYIDNNNNNNNNNNNKIKK